MALKSSYFMSVEEHGNATPQYPAIFVKLIIDLDAVEVANLSKLCSVISSITIWAPPLRIGIGILDLLQSKSPTEITLLQGIICV